MSEKHAVHAAPPNSGALSLSDRVNRVCPVQRSVNQKVSVFVNIVAAFFYAAFSIFSFEISGFSVIVFGRSQLRVVPLQREGFADFA